MTMKWSAIIAIFVAAGILSLVGNTIGYKLAPDKAAVGIAILLVIIFIGIALAKYLPFKLPMVFWVSIVAIASTSPISPFAKTVLDYTGSVDFLALTTPILAYAGLAAGKDLPIFKTMSWRIVIVAVAVYSGTFIFASMIAQLVLRLQGQI